MSQEFGADVRERGGLPVIALHGDLDAGGEETLRRAYEESERLGADVVLLDFRDVVYINSTGIALIVGLLAEARKRHRSVMASGLSEHYREIFQVTRLADFMPMFADEDQAVASLGAPAGAP